MNKRIIALAGAAVLALIGIVMLISYTNNANDRAFEGAQLASVLQVKSPVPANTKVADLAGSVELVKLPKTAIAKGAISDLADVAGLSTTVALEPGEQVLFSRFAKGGSSTSGATGGSKTDVPVGYQEVTVQLDTARAAGGGLSAGDLVGVVVSYPTNETGGFTQLAKSFVRVTGVNNGVAGDKDVGAQVLVTLAVKARDAGRVINAAEFGKLWLTKQNKDTEPGHGGAVTKSEVTQ